MDFVYDLRDKSYKIIGANPKEMKALCDLIRCTNIEVDVARKLVDAKGKVSVKTVSGTEFKQAVFDFWQPQLDDFRTLLLRDYDEIVRNINELSEWIENNK